MNKEEYIERTIKIMQQIDNVEILKKIYTFAKTLFNILQEEQGRKGGKA